MGRRVLFVDDHPPLVAAVKKGLAGDFELVTAGSGAEALALCATEGPFALVVSDQQMPGMAGTELLREVRARWPAAERMLVTGHADFSVAVDALQQGEVFRILAKPFDIPALHRAVSEGVDRHESRLSDRILAEELILTRDSLLDLTRRLEDRLHEQMDQLRSIGELSAALHSARSLEQIAERSVCGLSHVLGGRGVRLVLQPQAYEAHGLTHEHGVVDAHEALPVPIQTAEGEIGRFLLAPRTGAGRGLSDEERRMAETIATLTAVALHNEVRRYQRDEARHTTVFALARLAEERDNETGMHLERVAEYCRLAAEGLRDDGHYVDEIDQAFIEDLVRSSPLHDIGKVGIPDSILLKPGRLTADEWTTMRQHTTIGADTLRSIIEHTEEPPTFLEMGLDIAWCHHEQWDGSGYPRGLRGRRIPLAARILAVADCYDALTTRRPYKDPWPHAEAIEYFIEKRGSQFDPRVIDAFVARSALADGIRERLADPAPAPRQD